jgi:hypothetical protein
MSAARKARDAEPALPGLEVPIPSKPCGICYGTGAAVDYTGRRAPCHFCDGTGTLVKPPGYAYWTAPAREVRE